MLGVNIEFTHVHTNTHMHARKYKNTCKQSQSLDEETDTNTEKKKNESIYRIPVFLFEFWGTGNDVFAGEKMAEVKKNKPSVFLKKTRCCLQVKSCISLYRNREKKKT